MDYFELLLGALLGGLVSIPVARYFTVRKRIHFHSRVNALPIGLRTNFATIRLVGPENKQLNHTYIARVKIWNAGNSPVATSDFFEEHLPKIKVQNGIFVSMTITYPDDARQEKVEIIDEKVVSLEQIFLLRGRAATVYAVLEGSEGTSERPHVYLTGEIKNVDRGLRPSFDWSIPVFSQADLRDIVLLVGLSSFTAVFFTAIMVFLIRVF